MLEGAACRPHPVADECSWAAASLTPDRTDGRSSHDSASAQEWAACLQLRFSRSSWEALSAGNRQRGATSCLHVCSFARVGARQAQEPPEGAGREPGCLRFEVGRVTEDPGSPLGGLPSAAALCLLLTWPQRTSPSRGPEAEQVGFSPAVSKQDHDPLEGREISSVAHELYL